MHAVSIIWKDFRKVSFSGKIGSVSPGKIDSCSPPSLGKGSSLLGKVSFPERSCWKGFGKVFKIELGVFDLSFVSRGFPPCMHGRLGFFPGEAAEPYQVNHRKTRAYLLVHQ
jgi:hypothetical protein